MIQGDIRRAAVAEDTIAQMKQDANFFARPTLEHTKPTITPRTRISRWYKPPPRWRLFKGKGGESSSWLQAQQEEWDELMGRIEEAQYHKNSKLFFRLVQQATAIKKNAVPLQGIMQDGEVTYDQKVMEDAVSAYYSQLYKK